MRFIEGAVRCLMLEADVEVFVASAIAESIKGSGCISSANNGDSVQLEGTATREHWATIEADMSHIPSHIAMVEHTTNEAGLIDFSMVVTNDRLSNQESNEIVEFLRQRWDVRIPHSATYPDD